MEARVKGKQLFPHEIVKILLGKKTSTLEQDLLQLQWNDIRENVRASMEKIREAQGRAIDLGKLVAIADVSGSMRGTPILVAIALSILVSELAAPEFADRILTFSNQPSWIKFEPNLSLKEKVMKTATAPWHMNTDFEKAMDLILETAVSETLERSAIPDLIVFSDMQFDTANNTSGEEWNTARERLVQKYASAGLGVAGEPWPPPHITFWNLRGDTIGFPAQAGTDGVTMISGFSPSSLKLILSGENLEAEEIVSLVINEAGDVVLVEETKTPYYTMRNALDDPAYDKVREILGRSDEGLLKDYHFEQE